MAATWQSLWGCLSLLSSRDRRHLAFIVVFQTILAVLDLVGVLLLGLVAALGSASVTGGSVSLPFGRELPSTITDSPRELLWLAAIAGALLISRSISSYALTRRALLFLASRQARLSTALATSLARQSFLSIHRRASQDIAWATTTGVNAVTLVVIGNSVAMASEIALLAVLGLGLLIIDPVLSIATLVFFGAVGLGLHRALASWAARLGSEFSHTEVASISLVQELIRTIREVSVSGRRQLYIDRFAQLRSDSARVQADLQITVQLSKFVFEVALVVGAGMLVLSQLISKDVAAAMAIVTVFLTAASRIMPSLMRLQAGALSLKNGLGLSNRTLELAREVGMVSYDSVATAFDGDAKSVQVALESSYPGFVPDIRFRGVSFAYPDTPKMALEDLALTIEPGTSLALVGPTGAGKSTAADLILGVLQPSQGRVEVSGRTPQEAIRSWPGAIAYVPQETVIVSGTVRANVCLGLPESMIDDDRAIEALERAQALDFLSDGRDGLDTVVGEDGMRLSGGQRQRIGLARALYSRPRLLVLDEATSALDARTEHDVTRELQSLAGQVTLIVVAHRLATIRNCDLVGYLEGGKLLALGPFEDVRRMSPAFAHQASLSGL